jgi:hypothetical protein
MLVRGVKNFHIIEALAELLSIPLAFRQDANGIVGFLVNK